MKKMVRTLLSILIAAFLTLSLAGCPERAMAPKEKDEKPSQWDKKDTSAPAQPATTEAEKK
jgi:uncharacterized lipoprotein YehR (DUF1307 family)